MQYIEAFSKYYAKLKNINWSVSTVNADDELVISKWKHKFDQPEGNTIKYKNFVTRWSGPGSNELRSFLIEAYSKNQIIRAVIARTSDTDAVEAGVDASTLKNTFHVRKGWYGQLTL